MMLSQIFFGLVESHVLVGAWGTLEVSALTILPP